MSNIKTQPLSPNRMTFRESVGLDVRFFKGEPISREERNRRLDFACDNPTAGITGLFLSATIALFTAPLRTFSTIFTGAFGKKAG